MSNVGLAMGTPKGSGRGPSSRLRSCVAVLLALSVFVAVGAGIYWGLSQFTGFSMGSKDFSGEGEGTVEIVVKPGQTLAEIGQTLKQADVVASVDAWLESAQKEPKASSIGPGSYAMALKMSSEAAVARMIDPMSRVTNKLLLREGLRMWESLDKIHKVTGIALKDLEKAAADGKAIGLPKYAKGFAEGFLFPATYKLEKGEDATSILSRLLTRFDEASANVGLEAGAKKRKISPYEAMIIASLIQAEGHPADFDKISRVIYNRLNPKTWGGTYGLLQMDATVNYALKSSEINLTNDQLKNTDSKYNTYTHEGLPPTPINSPGEAAMKAALKPAKGNWLYYVTVNPDTGETKFTDNYDEFLRFKQELTDFHAKNG